jgi:predicted dithiol-disulfide oxidoreductase (DUF899 family)
VADEVSDPGLTSEQRAAIAVHNATQNRMCLNLSGNGQICVACSEVADQIDAAVEVERQRGQADLAVARREGEGLRAHLEKMIGWADLHVHEVEAIARESQLPADAQRARAARAEYDFAKAALAAPADGEEGKRGT